MLIKVKALNLEIKVPQDVAEIRSRYNEGSMAVDNVFWTAAMFASDQDLYWARLPLYKGTSQLAGPPLLAVPQMGSAPSWHLCRDQLRWRVQAASNANVLLWGLAAVYLKQHYLTGNIVMVLGS